MKKMAGGLWVASICILASTTGCGGAKAMMASTAVSAADIPQSEPVPLARSHFSRDPHGTLSEDKLQKILDAPIEIELPARIGVLPVITAKDWRGPGPDYLEVPAGVPGFVKELRSAESYSLVTEVMPIPSGALGMEALRMVAARYRLRYVILYRENTRQRTRPNAWSFLYATVIGALFIPSTTLHVNGYLEASLFDVKTGLLLFTVRRGITASRTSNVWHQNDKLETMQAELAEEFAPALAQDVKHSTTNFAEAMRVENKRRATANVGLPQPTEALFHNLDDEGEEETPSS